MRASVINKNSINRRVTLTHSRYQDSPDIPRIGISDQDPLYCAVTLKAGPSSCCIAAYCPFLHFIFGFTL
jgi:hypothetical protein